MDSKRQSGGKGAAASKGNAVAAPGASAEWEAVLGRSVGGRIRITTTLPKHTIEGTLVTACPKSRILALTSAKPSSTTPSSSPLAPPADFHLVPFAHIQNVQVLSLPNNAAAANGTASTASSDGGAVAAVHETATAAAGVVVPSFSRADMDVLRAREEAAVRKMKEYDSTRGKGVSREAQEVFDWFMKTLPVYWDGQSIIVNSSVRVDPPYAVENCKAPRDKQQAEVQIRKVLEGYYNKKRQGGYAGGGGGGGGGGGSASRPVVPAIPRKGG